MLTRAELLGTAYEKLRYADRSFRNSRETTTTSMISHILLEGDLDPTISVGGILKAIGGNIRVGNSGTFITEACEYTNSFLHFFPKISVILNIEEDHLDFFKIWKIFVIHFISLRNCFLKTELLLSMPRLKIMPRYTKVFPAMS